MQVIHTPNAPAAIGPYSQAVISGNFLFCSGQIPLDPASGQMKQASIEEEVKQVLTNLSGVVKAAGADLGKVVKTTIFLTDLSHVRLRKRIRKGGADCGDVQGPVALEGRGGHLPPEWERPGRMLRVGVRFAVGRS